MKLTPERMILNAHAIVAWANGKKVQVRSDGESNWTSLDNCEPSWQFHVSEYRPALAPVTRPWSKPDDVPGPACWIKYSRTEHGRSAMMLEISKRGIYIIGNSSDPRDIISWEQLSEGWEYSTDRKTWHKCEVSE